MLKLPFKKLQIWDKAMALTKEIFELTESFPKQQQYVLVSQMQRAAISIPSNIAEGSQRKSNKDFSYFLSIAKGSLAELETQLILAQELNYISNEKAQSAMELIEELSKMLYSFIEKLKNSDHSPLTTHHSP